MQSKLVCCKMTGSVWEVQTFGQGLFALDCEACPSLLSMSSFTHEDPAY